MLTITGLLTDLAEQSVAEAAKALSYKARRPRVRRMIADLEVLIERTRAVIGQARVRVDGGQPDGATRLVSLHEPDARPIRKGRLGKPVEFGYYAASRVMPRGLGLLLVAGPAVRVMSA